MLENEFVVSKSSIEMAVAAILKNRSVCKRERLEILNTEMTSKTMKRI